MHRDLHHKRPGRSAGFVTLGKLVLVLVLFGAYTGYKFMRPSAPRAGSSAPSRA